MRALTPYILLAAESLQSGLMSRAFGWESVGSGVKIRMYIRACKEYTVSGRIATNNNILYFLDYCR